MANSKIDAGILAPGLDDELCKVGRRVGQDFVLALSDALLSQYCHRRKNPGLCVYQVDQSNTSRGAPAQVDDHTWIWHTGPATRYVRVAILTIGAASGTGNAQLRVTSSTDATGVLSNIVADGAATFPDRVAIHFVRIAVTPDSVEGIFVSQEQSATSVRILAVAVQEHPISRLDIAVDTLGGTFISINPYLYPAGETIDAAMIDDLAFRVADLRRRHKKVLFYCGKDFTISNAAYQDIVTGSAVDLCEWPYFPSLNLPETADPSLAIGIRVLADANGGGAPLGNLKVVSGAGPAVTCAISNGTFQVFTGTGSLNRGDGKASVQAQIAGTAATVRFCSINVFETPETV